MRKITAKRFILELLRACDLATLDATQILQAANLLGLQESSIRVSLMRLLQEGLIESPFRGNYQLSSQAEPLNSHIESWRQGGNRKSHWNQEWIAYLVTKPLTQAQKKRSVKALSIFGFKEYTKGFFLRPNNLKLEPQDIHPLLLSLGMEAELDHMLCQPVTDSETTKWSALWDLTILEQGYQLSEQALKNSLAHLGQLPLEKALAESFQLGSDAIHTLTIDPQLPEEIMDSAKRESLRNSLIEYDIVGRELWWRFFDQFSPTKSLSKVG